MDDRRFDALIRQIGRGGSRRALLKTLIGIGGMAATGAVLHDTEAARRGYSGPPTFGPPPTQSPTPTNTPLPTTPPTQTPQPTQTVRPTDTPDPCGPTGVCCAGDDVCQSIPTYCDSTAQYPLLWRYHLCGSPGYCVPTAHVCDNAQHNCEIDACDDQNGCTLVDVQPGQIGSLGAVCCAVDNDCAGLPRHCVGDAWHYYACYAEQCEERVRQCGAGQCQEPIGCQVIGSM